MVLQTSKMVFKVKKGDTFFKRVWFSEQVVKIARTTDTEIMDISVLGV